MPKNLEPYVVEVTDNIRTAMLKITQNKHRAVVVVDGGKVVGTVSDGDIRRAMLKEILPMAPVEEIMNLNCLTTRETDPRKQTQILHEKKVTLLPVVTSQNELVDVLLAYEPFALDSP